MHDNKEIIYHINSYIPGNIRRVLNRNSAMLRRGYYGRVDFPAGNVSLMLAVDGDNFTLYINDEKVVTAEDGAIPSGKLAYSVHSGINTSYGTRCTFDNIELWTLTADN